MTAAVIAIAAAALAVAALVASVLVARRTRAHARSLDAEIERGTKTFDQVVAREAEARAEELERTLALARAQSLSALAEDERRVTEERRRELVKQAKSKGEDAKVSVRNIRRRAMEELHRIKKDGEAGEDEVSRAEKDLDKSTAQYVSQIEELVKHKEGELLEV